VITTIEYNDAKHVLAMSRDEVVREAAEDVITQYESQQGCNHKEDEQPLCTHNPLPPRVPANTFTASVIEAIGSAENALRNQAGIIGIEREALFTLMTAAEIWVRE